MTPIGQDVLKMMQALKKAASPTKASAIRSKIEAKMDTMTAKAQNEVLKEAARLGIWP